jgi:WD40 repeat protein
LKGHQYEVTAVAWSPDGARALSASHDRTLKLWDPMAGRELLTLRGSAMQVLCAAFSPDGKTILSGGADGAAQLWSVASP